MSKYQTCAHSAPWLPPIPLDDEEKGYPVGRFCKHACRSMAVIRDPAVCESCTQYTDPAKLITINTGDYHADIYFDRLEDMPLSNIRKVFKLLLADPWSNEGAIRQMTLYLDAAVIESKEAWKQASRGPSVCMKFSEICTFAVIYAAYLAARRGKRSRAATAHYEVRLLENIVNLVYILKTKIYRPGVFRVFYVYEPKKRLVQAPAFVDKVVQHAIVDNLLYDRITRSFILDNYASQKNKGLHFGLDRLKGFFTDYWNKHHTAEGWVLKCDVRHFFASINHDKLKEKLKKLDLEPVVYDLLCIYIDCSDGLPLGYQTSQLFALLFLDDFDHFVKEQLHIQYYGRYMDDFFLIHPDKEYLQFCLREIRAYMDSLGLELNEKTQIFPIRNGIDFLGFHTYLTESGKVIRKLRHSSIKRMRAKLRHWEKEYPAGLVTREQILQSWQAWDAHAAHGNTWALRQQVRDRVQNILKEEI